jgi:hypothetical protein
LFSERTASFSQVPKISKTTPWDGKDAVLEVEEYPLEDLLD